MRLKKFGLLVAMAMAVFASLPVAAQERFGTITGKVTDPSGLATPGVTVTVTNKETQRSAVVVTDGNGMFIARGLDPGRYSVKFELSGFTGQEAPDVILLLGATTAGAVAASQRRQPSIPNLWLQPKPAMLMNLADVGRTEQNLF